ncbi:hypothetical protein PHMEG_00017170 [Phytophthora megakarya]|uniref:Fibronectin type-III domain-containing protein n=1 Tax=Phytophthora megakarya TaxID=4795 RepID=A0A225VYJ9_9STRA|nr:hypothetical protein PHMEG_00017170 [Phytophthora megakarya]
MESATIVYTTGGEFEIKWTSSTDATTVLGYLVRVTPASAGHIFNLYNTTLSLLTVSGLSPRSAYHAEIAAWNSFGLGKYSDAIEVSTIDITLPSPPLSLLTIDVTNTNFTVTWELPRDDGGSAIVGYLVVVKDANGVLVLSKPINNAKLLLVVDGLTAMTTYNCYIFSATEAFPNNSAESSSAQIDILTAVGVVPGPPPAVTLVGQPRGGTLTFFINRPQYTGGMNLTSTTLYIRQTPEDGSNTKVGFSTACQIDLSAQNNGTCTLRKLLAITSYEVYATFSNDMVR